MRLRLDKDCDALYLRLDDSEIGESEEVKPGVILDFNAEGKVGPLPSRYGDWRPEELPPSRSGDWYSRRPGSPCSWEPFTARH